jgi:hypothetical protein
MLFLQENNTVLLLNQKTGAFEPFSDNIVNMNISPDGQKILYYNANQITLYHLNAAADKRTVALQTITNALQDVSWFGNDYIVASVGDNIIISEIDARNNVNSVTLPKTITLSGTMVALQQPRIFFNQQDKKLYVLTQHSLAVSQSLIP